MEKLLDYFAPNHYTLDFHIDKTKKLLKGSVTINGTVKNKNILLHAKNLSTTSVSIDNQPATFTQKSDLLSIPHQKTSGQNITINIIYTHKLTTSMQGAYLSTYEHEGNTETIVATQFESHYARECFPCIDEPSAKATFDLSITTDPTDTVLSNMPAKSQANGKTTFETTPKMSTYLLAFVIGKFKSHTTTSQHGVTVTTHASLAQPDDTLPYASDFAAKSLDLYDDLFKTPYPLPKLDQIAIPDFEAGAMENWGLVTYREQALLCGNHSALDQKLYVATVIAHELSHMWFGDLVTMAWWDDLWLNESFASLMETYAVAQISPELDPWDDFYSGTIVPALRRDCLPGVQPVKIAVHNPAEIATLFDGAIVYAKGARLMLMLMRLMGKQNFFAGLTDYFQKHKYQNTTSDDLWDALTPHANFSIKDFMTPWLTQPGYPVLKDNQQHRFLLTQGNEPNYRYPIPEVKDDLSGHYLIDLPKSDLSEKLASFDHLSLEQKLRLILDLELLAKTPETPSANLIPLLQKFTSETQPIIWDILSLAISDLKIFFDPDTAPDQNFKNFIAHLTSTQFHRLGMLTQPNEPEKDTKLRPTILSLVSFSENSAFKTQLTEKFQNTPITDFDPNTRPVILAALVKFSYEHQSREGFFIKNLLHLYQTSPDPELRSDLLTAITSTKNPKILKTLPHLMQTGTIRPGDRITFFVRLLRNHAAAPLVLTWLYQNWDWLTATEGDKTISDYPRYTANTIRTTPDFQTFKDFFEPKVSNPALTRTLKIAFAEIEARLNLITSDSPQVIAKIKQQKTKPESTDTPILA